MGKGDRCSDILAAITHVLEEKAPSDSMLNQMKKLVERAPFVGKLPANIALVFQAALDETTIVRRKKKRRLSKGATKATTKKEPELVHMLSSLRKLGLVNKLTTFVETTPRVDKGIGQINTIKEIIEGTDERYVTLKYLWDLLTAVLARGSLPESIAEAMLIGCDAAEAAVAIAKRSNKLSHQFTKPALHRAHPYADTPPQTPVTAKAITPIIARY